MNEVKEFYKNKAVREAVRAYLETVFNAEIIEKVHNRESVDHIADAIELVDQAFKQMEIDFGSKNKVNTINEAR